MPGKAKARSAASARSAKTRREALALRIEQAVYDYVFDNFGRGEAEDPSWYIPDLAEHVAAALSSGTYRAKHPIRYKED